MVQGNNVSFVVSEYKAFAVLEILGARCGLGLGDAG